MTRIQNRLVDLLQEIAKEEGTDEQGALRDIMTDFRHVSHAYCFDVDKAAEDSRGVYSREIVAGFDVHDPHQSSLCRRGQS